MLPQEVRRSKSSKSCNRPSKFVERFPEDDKQDMDATDSTDTAELSEFVQNQFVLPEQGCWQFIDYTAPEQTMVECLMCPKPSEARHSRPKINQTRAAPAKGCQDGNRTGRPQRVGWSSGVGPGFNVKVIGLSEVSGPRKELRCFCICASYACAWVRHPCTFADHRRCIWDVYARVCASILLWLRTCTAYGWLEVRVHMWLQRESSNSSGTVFRHRAEVFRSQRLHWAISCGTERVLKAWRPKIMIPEASDPQGGIAESRTCSNPPCWGCTGCLVLCLLGHDFTQRQHDSKGPSTQL